MSKSKKQVIPYTYNNHRMLEKEIAPHVVKLKVDGDKAFFLDLTDLHWGHLGVDKKALIALVEIVKNTPNMYMVIGGDATNHANRGSKSSPWEADMSPREEIKGKWHGKKLVKPGLIHLLAPIEDRILGVVDGNHNTTRLKEFNDMSAAEYYCDITGVPYLGPLAMVEIVVGKQAKNSYLHFIHHSGSTGRRKNVNALQDRVFNWEADVHWGEHTHKSHYARDTVVYYDRKNKKPIVRDRLYINGSSYLSWSGYAKDKLYSPNETGCKIVEMSGKRAGWDMRVYERVKDFVELNTNV